MSYPWRSKAGFNRIETFVLQIMQVVSFILMCYKVRVYAIPHQMQSHRYKNQSVLDHRKKQTQIGVINQKRFVFSYYLLPCPTEQNTRTQTVTLSFQYLQRTADSELIPAFFGTSWRRRECSSINATEDAGPIHREGSTVESLSAISGCEMETRVTSLTTGKSALLFDITADMARRYAIKFASSQT